MTMSEVVWVGMLLVALMTPLLVFLAKACQLILFGREQEEGDASQEALREFMVGSAALRTNRRELLENRKRYLESQLATFQVKEAAEENDGADLEAMSIDICKLQKGDLILPASLHEEKEEEESSNYDDDTASSRPMCAICVCQYQVGEKICWGSHKDCHHCFHKACIHQWLMRHAECPCCRLPFLQEDDDSKTKSNHRGNESGGDLGFSAQDEVAFQRMVANLRDSYRSLLNNTPSEYNSRQRREEEDTTMDTTSARSEEILVGQEEEEHHDDDDDDRINHDRLVESQHPLEVQVGNNELVDIELGAQEESDHHKNGLGEHSFPSSTTHDETTK